MKIEVKPAVSDAPKPSLKERLWGNKQKKIKTIVIGVIIIILILLSGVIYARYFSDNKVETTSLKLPTVNKKIEDEKKAESPLSGLSYAESLSSRHPLGVVVENHPDARPQSGLDKAEIIYEAISEGGITRFLAIFGPRNAEEIGPVRSARTFFVTWIQEYDGYFAHAGGSKDGLAQISADNVKNLPHTSGYFERQFRSGIASEHTLYTTSELLYKLAQIRKYSPTASFTSLKFKNEEKTENLGMIEKIIIPFSTDTYKVEWQYDKANNLYKRVMDGAPHQDKKSGQQLTAKNIIIQTVNRAPIALEGAKPTFKFTTEGSGKATVLIDGKKIDATWKKSTTRERTKFFDADGNEIKFNRGVFWYEIIPPDITPAFIERAETTTPAN